MEEKKKNTPAVVKVLNILSVLSIVIMVILVFVNAVLRYVFNSGLTEAEEYARFAFVWLSYLGILLAAKDGSHVAVTIVTDLLKGTALKVVLIIRDIIVLVTLGIIFYGAVRFTMASNYATSATATNFMLITVSAVIASGGMFGIIVYQAIQRIFHSDGEDR